MKIIKFDVSFYLLVLLSFLCGKFKNIIILYLIIFIHEFGHIFFIKYFNKEIISIKFYAFGGITNYYSLVNHKILEELLISIGGILFQLLLFIIILFFFKMNLINSYTYELFVNNNITLLLFNIIPMIGLDGEKIIHLILEYFIPFSSVSRIMIVVSLISIVIFIISSITLRINSIYIYVFLIYKLIKYINNYKYINNKFYLERYLYNIPFSRIVYLNNSNINNMFQDRYHFFNNVKEYDLLRKKYN